MINLSVVVPVYNEEDQIMELYLSITAAVRDKADSYEIVLVDDGSRDRSAAILDELAAGDETVIHFERHCGETAAISAGLKQSRGELIVLMDGGLQGNPQDIVRLMPFINKVDFINGRRSDAAASLLTRLPAQLGNQLRNWLTGEQIRDSESPLKLMTREVADSFHLYNGMHRYLPTLARMNGYSVIEVSVTYRKKKGRGFKLRFIKQLITGLLDIAVICMLKRRVVHYRIRSSPNLK
ncbi:glycosyltransferase family 2 protein [Paenibacillus sp. FSL R7-0345]|uniref:glycosyltransferase family 2 protein n=1 Tax=Paenibacillus sp. FSL R7-0345 TaxID=2954535 RepID=UPI00315A66C5